MKSVKMQTKLRLVIGLGLVITALIGVLSILSLRTVNKGVNTMYEERVIPLAQLKNVADAYAVTVVDVAHKALHGLMEWEDALDQLKQATVVVSENWNAYEKKDFDTKEAALRDEAMALRQVSKQTYFNLVEIIKKGESEETVAELDELIKNELYQTIDPYSGKVAELIQVQLDISNEIKSQADAIYSRTIIQTIIIIVLAIVALGILAFFIIRGILRQLGGEPAEVEEIARKVAEGELNFEFKKSYVGAMKSMTEMARRLKLIIGEIQTGSDNILGASHQLNSSSQQLNQSANEQASSVEEISSTMEEMVSNINSNSENSKITEDYSSKAKASIDDVAEKTQQTIQANQDIATKTSVITEIAFQTNILALNAAVEAASSGEHGKGFAVVATEVRKLAERSKVAADEIAALVEGGLHVATIAGDQMISILPDVEKTNELVREISSASIEQDMGAKQVNNALQQLNVLTQQNAASGEELAASSEELSAQADKLKEVVSYFKL